MPDKEEKQDEKVYVPNFIGLVGSPTSGKSDLAQELAKKLESSAVVDEYAEDIAKQGNLGLGMFATYFSNIAVAINRVCHERKAMEAEPKHIIVCGTHLETVAYASINGFMTQREDTMENALHIERMQLFMRFLGMMMKDTFGYSHIFYLPSESENQFIKQMNVELVQALETFEVDSVTLEGSLDQRLDKALEKINEVTEEQ